MSYSKVGSSNFGPRKKSALHYQQILYLSFKWQICILITNRLFFYHNKNVAAFWYNNVKKSTGDHSGKFTLNLNVIGLFFQILSFFKFHVNKQKINENLR